MFFVNYWNSQTSLRTKIKNKDIYKYVGEFCMTPYIVAFKAMNKEVKSCLSASKVGPNLNQQIFDLKKHLKV